ncbi:MAG: WbqC family protein [Calditrichaeota bacterium]|nr:WbqC family protein [Calditrichota bacterium]
MTLAVLQPGYLPGIPLFAMLAAADVVLLADDLQYSTRGNLNRARIKTAIGAQWLTVPVLTKGRQGQSIAAVRIDPYHEWRKRHWRSLMVNYAPAPYWGRYESALEEVYSHSWGSLLDLNQTLIELFTQELGLKAPKGLTSCFKTRPARTEKVVDLLRASGCDTYLVLRAEHPLLDSECIGDAGLAVRPVDVVEPIYHQLFGAFVPGLSVLDLLMNEGPAAAALIQQSVKVAP